MQPHGLPPPQAPLTCLSAPSLTPLHSPSCPICHLISFAVSVPRCPISIRRLAPFAGCPTPPSVFRPAHPFAISHHPPAALFHFSSPCPSTCHLVPSCFNFPCSLRQLIFYSPFFSGTLSLSFQPLAVSPLYPSSCLRSRPTFPSLVATVSAFPCISSQAISFSITRPFSLQLYLYSLSLKENIY